MRAYHANGFFPHTHAMTTHTMFAPYKSRVVSRGGLLLPLTYLPGTSVETKITLPGRSRRAPPAATDGQRTRGSSCAAGFQAELSAHKACRTREPSAALSHCVRGYHQPVGCGCRRAPPAATDRQRCRGSSCTTGFKCNNNMSHGYFRQCFAFITISWILVRYQYTRRYLRAALSQRYWMSTRCVLF